MHRRASLFSLALVILTACGNNSPWMVKGRPGPGLATTPASMPAPQPEPQPILPDCRIPPDMKVTFAPDSSRGGEVAAALPGDALMEAFVLNLQMMYRADGCAPAQIRGVTLSLEGVNYKPTGYWEVEFAGDSFQKKSSSPMPAATFVRDGGGDKQVWAVKGDLTTSAVMNETVTFTVHLPRGPIQGQLGIKTTLIVWYGGQVYEYEVTIPVVTYYFK